MLSLPPDAEPTIIAKPPMPVLADPKQRIAEALDAADLRGQASGGSSACILICDITRPVPNGLFLRPLIERLVAGGIAERHRLFAGLAR